MEFSRGELEHPIPERSADSRIETKFELSSEIFAVPPIEKDSPEKCPEIKIEESDKLEARIAAEKTATFESGAVGNVVYAYPSGLSLVLEPVFDGKPQLESFTGLYKAYLCYPKEYKSDDSLPMDRESIEKRIARPKTKTPVVPYMFDPTLTKDASRKLSLTTTPLVVLSDEFTMGYDTVKGDWIMTLDRKSLEKSEKYVYPAIHEAAHIPYMTFCDELMRQALDEAPYVADGSLDKVFEGSVLGSSGYIGALREDLAGLNKKTKEIIRERYQEMKKKYRPSLYTPILSWLSKQEEIEITPDDRERIDRVLALINLFDERMADARAAAYVMYMGFPQNGKVSFGFRNNQEIRDFFTRDRKVREAGETMGKVRRYKGRAYKKS